MINIFPLRKHSPNLKVDIQGHIESIGQVLVVIYVPMWFQLTLFINT